MQSDSIAALAAALSKAQGDITGALKDSSNPFFKSKYAELSDVWDAIRAPLAKHGLSVIQAPGRNGADVVLTTRLMHKGGQWLESDVWAAPTKGDVQGVGSTITYLRRYSLMAMIGVCPEDDDGNAASGRGEPPRDREPPPPPKVAPPPLADDTGFWGRESLEIPVKSGDYGAWSERLTKAIDAAPDLPKLNKLMSDNGGHLVAFERDEKAGAAFLKDRAAKRRGIFAQGEGRAA